MRTTLQQISTAALSIMIGLSFSGCSNNDEPASNNGNENEVRFEARADIALSETEAQLAKQSVDFSIRLLQSANKTIAGNEQMAISPLSASMALSMLNNGAANETQEELMEALGLSGFSVEDVNAFSKRLMLELNDLDNTSTISTANSVWLNEGFTPKKSFTGTLTENFDAEVKVKDFSEAKTVDLINEWCEEKTNGCIQDILKELSSEERLLLINALYFKAIWNSPFRKTEEGTFTTLQGEQQNASFIHKDETRFLYSESETFEMAEIQYGNNAFGFTVLLPKEGVGIDKCIEELTGEGWLEAVEAMKSTLLNLKLPKFKVGRTDDLTNALKEMGIVKAFSKNADFTSLSDEELTLSTVLQGNSISVDENGTEAAAVTIITAPTSSNEVNPQPIDFHADRPFLYFIKEKSTNVILFMGKIGKI